MRRDRNRCCRQDGIQTGNDVLQHRIQLALTHLQFVEPLIDFEIVSVEFIKTITPEVFTITVHTRKQLQTYQLRE